MTVREIIKMLQRDGWVEVKQTSGSGHKHFEHPVKKGKITVPVHKGDLPPRVVNNILKVALLK